MAGTVTSGQVMQAVERIMSRPFEWGPCDCSSAACDVFADLWGVDPMAPVRGYSGALAAHRLMARHGGLEGLAVYLAGRAGLSDGHVVGGLALSDTPKRQALLICVSPGLWAGKSQAGFAMLRSAKRGWHLA